MTICKEQYPSRPDAVTVFSLNGGTDVILRKDIAETQTESVAGEDGEVSDPVTVWTCEERQIRVPRALTVEDVTASFDDWWDYEPGTDDPEDIATEAEPGKAERLDALEAAVLEMASLLPQGDENARIEQLEAEIAALKEQLAQTETEETDG